MSTDHDPAGWHSTCTRIVSDGTICGLRYWFQWIPSAGSGKRTIAKDSTEPHHCREVGA